MQDDFFEDEEWEEIEDLFILDELDQIDEEGCMFSGFPRNRRTTQEPNGCGVCLGWMLLVLAVFAIASMV